MQNKGFTLMEMLVTLSVLSMFILLLPLLKPSERIALQFETQTLKERLLKAQGDAIAQKRKKCVDFHGNQYTIDDHTYDMNTNVFCSAPSFHFTPQGSISNALTIHCRSHTQSKEFTVQLGTGRIHAKY